MKHELILAPKILFVMLAFLLMVVVSSVYFSNMLQRHIENDTTDVLTKTKLRIESELLAPEVTLGIISLDIRDMILNNAGEDELLEYLHNITNYIILDEKTLSIKNNGVYGFFDVFGDKFLKGSDWQVMDNYVPKEHPCYLAAAAANGDIAVIAPMISSFDGSEVITYTRRLFDDYGAPLGVICLDTSIDNIREYVGAISLKEGCYGVLLDQNLNVLLHPSRELIGQNARDIEGVFAEEFLTDNSFIEYSGPNFAGVETVASACRLANGWILCVKISKDLYYQELYNMRLGIGILGIVLAVLLSVVLMSIDRQKRVATERVQIMLDSMPLGVSFLDKDFRYIDCNQEIVNLFGIADKQEYFKRIVEFSPEYQPCGVASEEIKNERFGVALMKGYDRFEWMHQGPDGEPIPCEKTLVRIKHRNNNNILVYTRDLRELKAAIAEMREANEYTRLMLDTIPLSCCLWDTDKNIIECNQETSKLFKLQDRALSKDNFNNLSPEYQPCGRRSAEKALEYLDKAFIDGSCRFEWTHLTANGEILPSEVILIRVQHKGKDIVASYIRDMREVNATLTAMHKAEEDLRLALAVAEDSAKAKSEFLSNMSHELRTPMNSILGSLRIAHQCDNPINRIDNIKRAEHSAKELLAIIDNVLDFTEIENNKMIMYAEPFKLADVFCELSKEYALSAKMRGLTLSMTYPADLPEEIIGDSQKLKQVLHNLIDNAVKYTDKGKISVRASIKSQVDNHVEMSFYVRDTGIGILPEQMESLFDPFWQADTSATRKYGGAGFGLALSKHLVLLLGGKLWAESVFEEGSTFHFTARFHLPSAPEASLTEQKNEEQSVPDEGFFDSSKAATSDAKDAYSSTQLSGARELTQLEAKKTSPEIKIQEPDKIQVLLVEDIEINQIIAEELLTSLGYAVDMANNGLEALEMLAQKKYDVILMDIQMPVMDGLTATRKIREKDEYKDLPIIAVTAHSLPADKEKSLNYGMNDHITKPLDIIVLHTTLNKWLSPVRTQDFLV